ncbi:hypothetical protein HY090_00230 [Candidatus Kaiserbacteria bacterium]|nr:hypothetical protein [Candidatus Kaiserbacteria bacterium]
MTLAAYEFSAYRTKKPDQMEHITVSGANSEAQAGFKRGIIIGKETNFARDLVNMSAQHISPENFANAGRTQFEGTKVVYKVLTLSEIKAQNMGLIEAVGRGSDRDYEPRFVVAEYWGAGKDKQKPSVLIGKGITYDTGGLSMKQPVPMHDMYSDMAGGASVLATLASLAKLGTEANVIAIVPMVENSVSDRAQKPSDIQKSKNGMTVHIDNTDAEGRLVLADAMTYAVENYDAESVTTVATLTGAATIIAGKKSSVVVSQNKELARDIDESSDETGTTITEVKVQPHRWEELHKDMVEKGNVQGADISNTGKTGEAGTLYGAVFINAFAEGRPHMHVDIAPVALADGKDGLSASGRASGQPTSLLVNYIERRQKAKAA